MNNILKTTFLLALLTILYWLPWAALSGGKGGMIVAFLMAAVMNFSSYWFSDKIVLRRYNVQKITREVHPVFYSMVGRWSRWGMLGSMLFSNFAGAGGGAGSGMGSPQKIVFAGAV
jgi:Zn-dependent protease with chaperone function